ncbi:unnamed protein product (mitochondrion) [Plasmodiophora brassicae]|uniref:Tyrosine-protein kinase ephrin type A/B receptor-like domain-containing protein n=1 Tax=Plasmodiophora brassicae TaxID=37360 RepID=A0A3P3Y920_PLABS|nr:unnamed protein product [Plasmodiophora brassicae]
MALLQRLLTLLVLGRGWAAPSCLLGPTCPPGSVCPTGSSRPLPCPVGRFVPTPGSVGYGDCLACTPGFYCNASGLSAPSGPCAPGYYCPSGSTSATAVTCPSGNYCPGAAPAPVPCSPGTYQNTTGSSSCSPCLQGFRCPTSGLASYLPCLPGHFCPGSTISTENPCPAGRYSPSTQLTSASQCLPCPPGKYCAGTANTAPTAPCAPGFACFGGASAATPADNVTGQACAPGAFCPSGSTRALPCPAGSYCATSQLTNTSGFCDAGYICYGSATRSAPTDGVTGIRVPAGFWSASGDVSPTPCPVGRFAPSPGNPSPSSCLLCTPGFYCASTGLSGPTAPCTSGYYCPSGTIAPTLLCPPGSQCPQQAATAMPCPAGTYQDLYGQALCKTCPQGYFCAGSGNTGFALCPPGAYCPSNTTFANQFPCPSGTFSNLTGLVTAAECTPCPPSQYCLGVGQTQPTASCWPGWVLLQWGFDKPNAAVRVMPSWKVLPVCEFAASVVRSGNVHGGDGEHERVGVCAMPGRAVLPRVGSGGHDREQPV